jgi:CRP-like cAMP-binding protein
VAPSRRKPTTGNRLLDALPGKALSALPLEHCDAGLRDLLFEQNEPIQYIIFPTTCVCSMVTQLDNGGAVELATIGHEGMVGVPVFLGASSTNARGFVQVPGQYLRLRSRAFRQAVDNGGPLHGLVRRYAQALFSQIAQNVACNRAHAVEQRCARWLLQTADRVGTDEFLLTQEFLGQMLGVRRATVNAAARALQDAGLITYRRGRITITDRPALEAASCECYAVVAREFERLTP